MDFLRNGAKTRPPIRNNKSDIIFQCLDWIGTNETKTEKNPDVKSWKKTIRQSKHVVKIYGVTKEGYSVSVNNTEFKPYFYIKVDDNFTELHLSSLIEKIKTKLDKSQDDLISADIIKKKDFYSFISYILIRKTPGLFA